MSVSISPSSSSILRGQPFSITINASASGTVTSVNAVLNGSSDNISISNGNRSTTISGSYDFTWNDVFTYVNPGQSDKTQTPISVTFKQNLPPSQNLFNLNQDLRSQVTRTYTITIRYIDSETGNQRTGTRTFSHNVLQDWEIIRDVITGYDYKAVGG